MIEADQEIFTSTSNRSIRSPSPILYVLILMGIGADQWFSYGCEDKH